ncbi:MAG TPA: isoprenylcysteine carboxylmethyltransferase family protein [Chloroflexia bacterium]
MLLNNVRGRVARPASVRRNLAKTLLQVLLMWLAFFFLAPMGLYWLESKLGIARRRFASPFWRRVGVVLFAAGGTLGLTSAWFMVTRGEGTPLPADATRALVVAGPYRYVRNPMAIGSFAQGIAVGLFLGSPLATAYALAGSVGWNYFVRPWEELDLERRFGAPYRAYKERVRCWIPRLEPYKPEEAAEI